MPVLELRVTPLGRAPVSLKAGVGKPVAVTVNVPPVFTSNTALFALVIAGGWPMVSVKFCVAFGDTLLLAVMVMLKIPVALAVPPSTPAGLSVMPLGNAPVSVMVGAGKPVAVTANVPAAFATK